MPTMDKMARAVGKGINRTGMKLSSHEKAMREVTELTVPTSTNGGPAVLKKVYMQNGGRLGSVPPPAQLKGAVAAGKDALKGNDAFTLIDRMGERLAFERTGVRLYDALIAKLSNSQSWEGGPTLSELQRIREEELEHFLMLKEEIQALGGDPTVMTPSADVVAVESEGIGKVLADPRTDLAQALHGILVAELADGEGWQLLTKLAQRMEHNELANKLERAERQEEDHLRMVREWLSAHVLPAI